MPSGEASVSWVGDDIGYSGAHMRIRAERGRADGHDCVGCGEQAMHWSYNHDDPNGLSSKYGSYSPDPQHYSPRCVSCHKVYDLERT